MERFFWYPVLTMPKSLPSPWQLIVDSWTEYLRTWNDSMKVSIWFLYTGLIYFVLYLSIKLVPDMIYAGVFVAIGILVIWSWTITRLIDTCLRIDDGKKVDHSREGMIRSWKLVLPLFWVGILQMLVLLGTFIPFLLWRFLAPQFLYGILGLSGLQFILDLLLLPLIYISVRIGFSQIIAIDRGDRGMDALARSSDMTKGNFWQILLRQISAAIVFGVGIWAVLAVVFIILGMVVGPQKFILLADPTMVDPLLLGVVALLESIIQAIAMPLVLFFSVKLYKAFKTR